MHIYIHKYAQIYDNMHAIERERGLGWGYKFIYKRGALPDSFTVFPLLLDFKVGHDNSIFTCKTLSPAVPIQSNSLVNTTESH